MRVADRVILDRAQAEPLAGVIGRLLEPAIVEHQRFGLGIFEEQLAVVGAGKPAGDLWRTSSRSRSARSSSEEVARLVMGMFRCRAAVESKIVFWRRVCEGPGKAKSLLSRADVADFFVSYTSKDRLKAFWIGQELMKLGHAPRIHEWEIDAGGNIPAWMEKRHHDADHVLFVISKAYLAAPYSNWERQAAQWAAADKRPNFALPVFIENCEPPTLLVPDDAR